MYLLIIFCIITVFIKNFKDKVFYFFFAHIFTSTDISNGKISDKYMTYSIICYILRNIRCNFLFGIHYISPYCFMLNQVFDMHYIQLLSDVLHHTVHHAQFHQTQIEHDNLLNPYSSLLLQDQQLYAYLCRFDKK